MGAKAPYQRIIGEQYARIQSNRANRQITRWVCR